LYGYINNQTGEYVPDKNDLNSNFTFSGSRFEESSETESEAEVNISENMTSADMIAVMEQIIEKFEEVQKDSPQIEQIKDMHSKILSNIKGADS
jgi:hypothetical protein